ncbi:unnamed protein product [Bemisia tabaci]|uniref:Uncharacterized protein n=1 Tax=Bemisia tabaci TaxID=7038 RepID=A0A9P0A9F7_BEMTA|nr:unnamed protein product [Bemisia tabaci]
MIGDGRKKGVRKTMFQWVEQRLPEKRKTVVRCPCLALPHFFRRAPVSRTRHPPVTIYATRAPEMQMQTQPMRLEPSNGMMFGGPPDPHMGPMGPMADQNQHQNQQVHPPPIQNQNQNQGGGLGWFFGLQDATVTNTVVRPFTKTVTDPNTIVTFSVKGCQPSRLPFDLGPCEDGPFDKDEAELAKGPASGTPTPPPSVAAARGAVYH